MALCKVLVVEPDARTRETIDEILTTLDCTYEAIGSLAETQKLLPQSNHDLVLSAFDMPSRPGSKPRPQNSEHFMHLLRKARPQNMPKVIMLIANRPYANQEDIIRWGFEMRDLGVTDVVGKPLPDEGRTLDRVIRKVLSDTKDKTDLRSARRPETEAEEKSKPARPEKSASALSVLNQDSLTRMQMDILEALAESRHQTMFIADIMAAGGYGKFATSQGLLRLEQLGLIHRPEGRRKGVSISERGRELLTKVTSEGRAS